MRNRTLNAPAYELVLTAVSNVFLLLRAKLYSSVERGSLREEAQAIQRDERFHGLWFASRSPLDSVANIRSHSVFECWFDVSHRTNGGQDGAAKARRRCSSLEHMPRFLPNYAASWLRLRSFFNAVVVATSTGCSARLHLVAIV